jgi:heat shock protein HtpX
MPQVEIMETPALNAYAAGLGPGDAVVAVTRGLLEALDADELEAVLAHEITHIKNRDVRLMVVASVFAGGLTMVGDSIRAALTNGDARIVGDAVGAMIRSGRSASNAGDLDLDDAAPVAAARGAAVLASIVAILIAIAALCLVHLFALLTQFAISRSREYMADAGAVELTKNPDALISALNKISGNDEMPEMPASVSAMMISAQFGGLLSTHPPIDERVRALVDHAGGQVRARRATVAARARTWGPVGAQAGPVGAVGFGRRRAVPR